MTPRLTLEPEQTPSPSLSPPEILIELRDLAPDNLSVLLHFLATRVSVARLSNCGRILDASDFAEWLKELGIEAPGQVHIGGWR